VLWPWKLALVGWRCPGSNERGWRRQAHWTAVPLPHRGRRSYPPSRWAILTRVGWVSIPRIALTETDPISTRREAVEAESLRPSPDQLKAEKNYSRNFVFLLLLEIYI
jgi:hypothetical protein